MLVRILQAHRNITSIKDISYVPDDVRAFRITFDDDGELVSVEYQAENPRMCGTYKHSLCLIVVVVVRDQFLTRHTGKP